MVQNAKKVLSTLTKLLPSEAKPSPKFCRRESKYQKGSQSHVTTEAAKPTGAKSHCSSLTCNNSVLLHDLLRRFSSSSYEYAMSPTRNRTKKRLNETWTLDVEIAQLRDEGCNVCESRYEKSIRIQDQEMPGIQIFPWKRPIFCLS